MKPIFRLLTIFSLALALVAVSWAGAGAQIAPLLAIPDGVPGTPGELVTLPVIYSANGNLCSSLSFAIDFDETQLSFDPTDADQDGVPDAISLNVPPGFFGSASYDGTDTNSEIDVFFFDPSLPLTGVPSRNLLFITFTVNPGFTGFARVGFSASDPTASCGTMTGQGLIVSTDDGSVATPLAVQIHDFQAQGQPGSVLLIWETASELDNQGFNLWRNRSPDGPTEQINATVIASQAPGSPQGFTYTWEDTDVVSGQTYFYWLEDIDLNGTTTLHGPVSATVDVPTAVTVSGLRSNSQSADGWLTELITAVKAFLTTTIFR